MSLPKLLARNGIHPDSEVYESANELAIDLINTVGYRDPEDKDIFGDKVGNDLQSLLVEVFLRSPAIDQFMEDALRANRAAGKEEGYPAYIKLRATAIVPGVTFMDDDTHAWITTDSNLSGWGQVLVKARTGDMISEDRDFPQQKYFLWDAEDTVNVIGVCNDPSDPNANDWGQFSQ